MYLDKRDGNYMLTLDDFNACGWKETLAGVDCPFDYSALSQAFLNAAKQAISKEKQTDSKVLNLLAYICSMILSPGSDNEPFKRCYVLSDGRCSMGLDDLSADEIEFVVSIVDSVDEPFLKARLADLAWVLKKPRDVTFARTAIDGYLSIPLDAKIWKRCGRNCWQRALNLAGKHGIGTDEHKSEIETSIVAAFTSATAEDGSFGLELANLLKSNALGGDVTATIGSRLENLGSELTSQCKPAMALKYYQASAEWYRKSGNDRKWVEMIVEVGEGWAAEASTHEVSDHPKHGNAANCYERSIQCYRGIPGTHRKAYRVDERISELRQRYHESLKKSLNQMSTIKSRGLDLTQIADTARKAVMGKSSTDALESFVNLRPLVNAKKLRESVIERLKSTPLLAMFSRKAMNRDGHVVKNVSGDDKEAILHDEMIRNYRMNVEVDVRGIIVPALDALLLEHRFCVEDFIDLGRQSPLVPAGREYLFGRGLYAGCDYDFATAIHVLAPQIEHVIRLFLNQEGVSTTHYKDGVETERSLGSLICEPEAEEIFGPDLTFELRTLFCEPTGPNLRNHVAHGMLNDNESQSAYTIYAWWLTLRLVVNSVLNASDMDAEIREDEREE